jgi:hypothetical protein
MPDDHLQPLAKLHAELIGPANLDEAMRIVELENEADLFLTESGECTLCKARTSRFVTLVLAASAAHRLGVAREMEISTHLCKICFENDGLRRLAQEIWRDFEGKDVN